MIVNTLFGVKATVENPRGSVEKLSPKNSVEGADTLLRGSVRAPEGFSEGKPEAPKLRGRSPRGTLLKRQFFHSAPRIFNSCSDYQNRFTGK